MLISSDREQINKNFAKVFQHPVDTESFLRKPDVLFDGITDINILVLTSDPSAALSELLASVEIIMAGGGIVSNERDELLLIFRRGHWDLPKGKIELRESMLEGAVREVTEETGVTIAETNPEAIATYHAYKLKGRNIIKHTDWFYMQAKHGQNKLTPQTEEDIDEVKWVAKKDLKNYEEGCYPLIWSLLEPLAKQ